MKFTRIILLIKRKKSLSFPNFQSMSTFVNPVPQSAPGSSVALGHTLENSIPLSIFPVATDKHCIVFCGLPGRGKTHIARRLARYLDFFHAIPVKVFDVNEYRRRMFSHMKDSAWFDSGNEEGVAMRKYFSSVLNMHNLQTKILNL